MRAYLLLILTGARKREILDARWEDIDFERKTLMFPVTKSGKPRTVPLSSNALEILKGLPRVNEFIFPSPKTGKPFVSIFNSWNQARKRAGLEDVRIHDLRHSFASFLVNRGRSIYEVGRLLGHTQIKTTIRYAHLSDQTLVYAVNQYLWGMLRKLCVEATLWVRGGLVHMEREGNLLLCCSVYQFCEFIKRFSPDDFSG